ncbi:MAG: glutathione-dependent disulfide-bond oxidoreductase [Pseudomonadota bacterium]
MADSSTEEKPANQPPGYEPPKVWRAETASGGRWSSINKPTAGAQFERELPVGKHPLQLYSLGTPNGVKVTIMLEELLAAGHTGAEYDAWLIRIGDSDQFGSGFTAINPNSKIPAMVDHSGPEPVRVFESASILFHLAEKFGAFLAPSGPERAEAMNWLMWQMGAAPFLGGGFGHFYAYAPFKMEYPIDRYAMEAKRHMDVLDQTLATRPYIAGDTYTIADMAIWPWYGNLALGRLYSAGEFLDVTSYTHVLAWAEKLLARPAVQRGRMVNRVSGEPSEQLHERHDASDFDTKTEDKIAAE